MKLFLWIFYDIEIIDDMIVLARCADVFKRQNDNPFFSSGLVSDWVAVADWLVGALGFKVKTRARRATVAMEAKANVGDLALPCGFEADTWLRAWFLESPLFEMPKRLRARRTPPMDSSSLPSKYSTR